MRVLPRDWVLVLEVLQPVAQLVPLAPTFLRRRGMEYADRAVDVIFVVAGGQGALNACYTRKGTMNAESAILLRRQGFVIASGAYTANSCVPSTVKELPTTTAEFLMSRSSPL